MSSTKDQSVRGFRDARHVRDTIWRVCDGRDTPSMRRHSLRVPGDALLKLIHELRGIVRIYEVVHGFAFRKTAPTVITGCARVLGAVTAYPLRHCSFPFGPQGFRRLKRAATNALVPRAVSRAAHASPDASTPSCHHHV